MRMMRMMRMMKMMKMMGIEPRPARGGGGVVGNFWVYSARRCLFSSSRSCHGHGTHGQAWITEKTIKVSKKIMKH